MDWREGKGKKDKAEKEKKRDIKKDILSGIRS